MAPVRLSVLMLLASFGYAGQAKALCDAHFVNGNETKAPAEFGDFLERRDWASLSALLTEKISITVVGGETRTAAGKDATLTLIREFSRENSGNYPGDHQEGIQFGKWSLMANHWVTARIIPQFKDEEYKPGEAPPPPPLHGPTYFASYSAAFLPDCEGKIERIVIVERNLIGG